MGKSPPVPNARSGSGDEHEEADETTEVAMEDTELSGVEQPQQWDSGDLEIEGEAMSWENTEWLDPFAFISSGLERTDSGYQLGKPTFIRCETCLPITMIDSIPTGTLGESHMTDPYGILGLMSEPDSSCLATASFNASSPHKLGDMQAGEPHSRHTSFSTAAFELMNGESYDLSLPDNELGGEKTIGQVSIVIRDCDRKMLDSLLEVIKTLNGKAKLVIDTQDV